MTSETNSTTEGNNGKLPTVLLLGDSIRQGYGPFVRGKLQGKANVYEPAENCRFTYYTLRGLYDWQASAVPDAKAVDIVHWNNGLWDLGQRDSRPDCLTPIDVYTDTLVRIYGELRHYFPNAKIIFATTTPINLKIDCEQHTLGNAVVEQYNAAARAVLEPRGVLIDDLYDFVAHHMPESYADIVHYTPAGYDLIADEVIRNLPIEACSVPSATDVGGEKEPLKVLMIGNSFSICVLKQAPSIAENLGCSLKLCSMYIGGCSLEQHANNLAASEESIVNRQYWVTSNFGHEGHFGIPETLAKEKWDIVTIQQASHFSAFADTYHPWVDRLIAGIRKYAPQAEIRVQQTWSYSKLDGRVWDEADGLGHWTYADRELRWSQADMYANLTANYVDLAKSNGFQIIPTGKAVQLFRERRPVAFLPDRLLLEKCREEADPTKNDDPVGNIRFSVDSIHLSPSGEYLQGLVWIGQLFGIDPTTCTYKPDFVSDEDAMLFRECARDALVAAKSDTL